LLTRKSSETRRTLLTMLLQQSEDGALASAGRLLGARTPPQRLAGLDLLRELAQAGRATLQCREAARAYQSARAVLTADERTLITAIIATGQPAHTAPSLVNVLSLVDPAARTQPIPPRRLSMVVDTPAARSCLVLLDELIEQHRATPVVVKIWKGSEERLFGNLHGLAQPNGQLTPHDDVANLLLAEVWQEWERTRPASTRDEDGLELLRAQLLLDASRATSRLGGAPALLSAGYIMVDEMITPQAGDTSEPDTGTGQPRLQHRRVIADVLEWLVRLQASLPSEATDFLLDVMETTLALMPLTRLEELVATLSTQSYYSYSDPRNEANLPLLRRYRALHPAMWTEAHVARYWQLLHWLDQPVPGAPRLLPDLELVLRAHHAGAASEADILDHLVAPATTDRSFYGSAPAPDLHNLTARKPHPLLESYPVLQRLVPALRGRILDLELTRGEIPTPATNLALSLRHAGGMDVFVSLLAALASRDLVRG
jgi:hypothetical protein